MEFNFAPKKGKKKEKKKGEKNFPNLREKIKREKTFQKKMVFKYSCFYYLLFFFSAEKIRNFVGAPLEKKKKGKRKLKRKFIYKIKKIISFFISPP